MSKPLQIALKILAGLAVGALFFFGPFFDEHGRRYEFDTLQPTGDLLHRAARDFRSEFGRFPSLEELQQRTGPLPPSVFYSADDSGRTFVITLGNPTTDGWTAVRGERDADWRQSLAAPPNPR